MYVYRCLLTIDRLLMCFMCGDAFNVEVPLTPLLSHQCCYVNHIDRFPTVTVETYIDEHKRRVEVRHRSLSASPQLCVCV